MQQIIYRRQIGTTVTKILDSRQAWRDLRVASTNGIGIVYLGFGSDVTTSNGYPVPANQIPVDFPLAPGLQLWAVGSSSDDEIGVMEIADRSTLRATVEGVDIGPAPLRRIKSL